MTPGPTRLAFASHGARIEIWSDDPAVLTSVASRLPPGATPWESSEVDDVYSILVRRADGETGATVPHRLFAGSDKIAESHELDQIFEHLESVLHFNVATRARERLFVHAGVVGWRRVAIVLPGRSMSGKTTLVDALVRAGATYYSDEYAVLDESGLVHPYAKPLSLRSQNGDWRIKRSISDYGAQPGIDPLPVGLVATLTHVAGSAWSAEVITPAQAVLSLLDNTVLARTPPPFALPALSRLALGAVAVAGPRGEAVPAASRLLDCVSEGGAHES